MTTKEIATENGISSTEDLAKLPTPKLVALFNSIPGVTQVKKFTTRNIGINRIAKLMDMALLPASLAVAKEGAATAPKVKKVRKPKVAKVAKVAKAKKTGKRVKATGTHKDAKKAEVIRQLGLTNGTTLGKIMETTGWQAHTVRGFISILKSKEGLKIESTKTEKGERTYRIK